MPSSKGKPTDPKLREKVKDDVKNETNKDGGGKGQWSAWKAAKLSKEYEAKGGSYENEAGSKNEPKKGAPTPKSNKKKDDEVKGSAKKTPSKKTENDEKKTPSKDEEAEEEKEEDEASEEEEEKEEDDKSDKEKEKANQKKPRATKKAAPKKEKKEPAEGSRKSSRVAKREAVDYAEEETKPKKSKK